MCIDNVSHVFVVFSSSQVAMQFDFNGVISSCFEPHLGSYVELEEKTLMETLEKLIQVAKSSYCFPLNLSKLY